MDATKKKRGSPYKLYLYLVTTIFAVEFFVMSFFEGQITDELRIINPLVLSVVLSPFVYFYAIRPLKLQIIELEKSDLIAEGKARDEAILESIGEGMIATDDTGKITMINHVAEGILEWTKDDLLKQQSTDVLLALDEQGNMIPPEKHPITIATTTGATVTSNTAHYVHQKTGKKTPVAFTVTPVILNGKITGAIAIFRDITKDKELEEARRDLLSLASHQLRTPLSGIKWLIETLKRGVHGDLPGKQKGYIEEIYKINERMTSLVDDMMRILRMENDSTLTKKELVSSKEIFTTLSETLIPFAEKNRIKLHIQNANDYIINTDKVIIRNIFENLISNAINYSKEEGEVFVSMEEQPGKLIFIVKDSGIGIPKKEQPQLFTRFYRASNAKTFSTKGTGLGLYIVALLSKKIGVEVTFESTEGIGTTFYAHIPYHNTDLAQESNSRV